MELKRVLAIVGFGLCACTGVAQYNVDCTGDLGSGYACNQVDIAPYITPTPLPPTTGTFTLGSTFDPYLPPGTDITWSIVTSPGPVHLIDYGDRAVVMSATELGDYVIEARWLSQGITYTAPFTLTVVP